MSTLQPYAEVFKTPKGPGDVRPTALKVLQDQKLTGGSFAGKVIMITGTSSGLGVETAKALATTGATLYLTARNLEKAREALGTLVDSPKVHLLELDLMSLASVRSCAEEFFKLSSQLNILINNAGIRNVALGQTKDGFEKQFGVNHLAHFLLFQLLKPTLLASSTPEFHSRVIALSSSDHRNNDFPIQFDDLNFSKDKSQYTPGRGYTQSKLANLYMTNEINRRYGPQGLNANAVQPGGIMTGLQQGENGNSIREILSSWKLIVNLPRISRQMKNPEQGCATTVWGAVSKDLEGKGGYYLEDCGVAGPMSEKAFGVDPGHGRLAFDEDAAKKLWNVSNEMVGLAREE